MTSFPSAIVTKPSNISDGLAILSTHVGTLWDEVVQMEGELLGAGSGAFILDIRPSAAGNTVIRTRQASGDTNDRFNFNGNGKLFWGTGSAVSDLQIERSAARFLKVTGAVDIRGQNSSEIPFNLYGASGISVDFMKVMDSTASTTFLELSSTGQIKLPTTGSTGGLSIGGDTTVYRSAASTLLVNNALNVNGNLTLTNGTSLLASRLLTATSTQAVGLAVTADTNDRFQIMADGTLNWGPGNAVTDTSITRSGANALTTAAGLNIGTSQVNGNLTITGNLTVSGSTSSTPSSDVSVGAAFSFAGLAATATTTPKLKTSVTTDTNNRFQITADGAHTWGPGNSATDTSLIRSGVNALTTTAALSIGALTTTGVTNSGTYNDVSIGAGNAFIGYTSTASGTVKLKTRVTGDTVDRFSITANGDLNWGPGNAVSDTSLVRSGVGALTTFSTISSAAITSSGTVTAANLTTAGTLTAAALSITGDLSLAAGSKLASLLSSATNTTKIQFQISSDTGFRFTQTADGTQTWGSGASGGGGQSIQYVDANTLKTTGTWQVGTNLSLLAGTSQISIAALTSTSTVAYTTRVTGDAQPRFQLMADGTHNWGSGSAGTDTTLTRSAAGVVSAGSGALLGTNVQVTAASAFQGLLSSLTSTIKYQTSVAADTNNRFQITADGGHSWGAGNAAVDTFLTRNAAGDLLIDRSTTAKTRLALRRPDGTIRWISIDNNDQLLLETS